MNIRQATVEDAKTIAELNTHVQQVHMDALPHIYKPPFVDDALIAFYVDFINKEIASVFIAEDEGQAVGYICAVVQQRPEHLFAHARQFVLVDQMSVNPEYYGTGVADQLMQVVKDFAVEQDMNRIMLDVLDFNKRATKFYEKQGFKMHTHRMELVLE